MKHIYFALGRFFGWLAYSWPGEYWEWPHNCYSKFMNKGWDV